VLLFFAKFLYKIIVSKVAFLSEIDELVSANGIFEEQEVPIYNNVNSAAMFFFMF
jgi:hypothetical protein